MLCTHNLQKHAGHILKSQHVTSVIVRVSTRVVVVVVVVRELFSLLTSAICVRIRGRGQRLRRLFTT